MFSSPRTELLSSWSHLWDEIKYDHGKMPYAWLYTQSLPKSQACVAAVDNACYVEPIRRELENSSPTRLMDQLVNLCNEGQLEKAVGLLIRMDENGIVPSENAYRILMKACLRKKNLDQVKRVHSHFSKNGLDSNLNLGEDLLNTFAKCGSFNDAFQAFQKLTSRTVFSWTCIITACVDSGKAEKALDLYHCLRENGLEPNEYTYVSLMKACGDIYDFEEGKRLHAEASKKGICSNSFINSALVGMYGKCAAFEEAEDVFIKARQPDVVTHNVMLGVYAERSTNMALEFYRKMEVEGLTINNMTIVAVLLACRRYAETENAIVVEGQALKIRSLKWVQEVHADACSKGFNSNLIVGNNILIMYGKCGDVREAECLFVSFPERDTVSWTAMLSAYVEGGQAEKAVLLYRQIIGENVTPDGKLFVCVIQACSALANDDLDPSMKVTWLEIGRAVHSDIKRRGLDADPFVANTLIIMYGKCESMMEAYNVFLTLPNPELVSYNAMLSAYLEIKDSDSVLQFYKYMLEQGLDANDWTFPTLLQACCLIAIEEEAVITEGNWIRPMSFEIGQALHSDAERRALSRNRFVGVSLINMYGKCGSLSMAEKVFLELHHSDSVSWQAMLSVYVEQLELDKAFRLYRQMQEEHVVASEWTYLIMLQACCILAEEDANFEVLEISRAFHSDAWRRGFDCDVHIGSSLVNLYKKCDCLSEAEFAFCKLTLPNIVTWNCLLSAYVESKDARKALLVYRQMQDQCIVPDEWSISLALQACCILGEITDKQNNVDSSAMDTGRALHCDALMKGLDSSTTVRNNLVSMYGRCGNLWEAEKAFWIIQERGTDSWNEMLSACVFQGQHDKALEFFNEMLNGDEYLDETTVVCALQACSETGSIDICRYIHTIIASSGIEMSLHLATTLVHTYGSCASMSDAQAVFDMMPEHDVVSWSALITGYAREGNSKASQQWYKKMQDVCIVPNKITFLSLLSACSQAGLINEGIEYLESMSRDYGIIPEANHIMNMIDLLARAGDSGNVEDMFSRLSLNSDVDIWLSLLAGCQRHGNVHLGEKAFGQILQLQPDQELAYVLMSNIYVGAQLWDKADLLNESRSNVLTVL